MFMTKKKPEEFHCGGFEILLFVEKLQILLRFNI
jgi:hypothetical protein